MRSNTQLPLLATVVLAWGLSWYAIALQLGTIPVEVSIAYRFLFAGVALLGWCLVAKPTIVLPLRAHPLLALMGVLLFSLNFVFMYSATEFIASGIASVVFASASLMGTVNAWLFDGSRPSLRLVAGACAGVAGLALLFLGQGGVNFAGTLDDAASGWLGPVGFGLLLALAGTYCFSLGNIVSTRVRERMDFVTGTAWAMLYGGGFAAVAALIRHGAFVLPAFTASYLLSLLYLVVGASLVGFLAYLELVRRAGPARAAYATVLFPLVALVISSLFEGVRWNWTSFAGVGGVLLGALMVFVEYPMRQQAASEGRREN